MKDFKRKAEAEVPVDHATLQRCITHVWGHLVITVMMVWPAFRGD
jgi:hypothetical protein